jgi:hypothetical protein
VVRVLACLVADGVRIVMVIIVVQAAFFFKSHAILLLTFTLFLLLDVFLFTSQCVCVGLLLEIIG